VVGDELTFILLARHTMLRALRKYLKAHKVDMKQFSNQEHTIIKRINKYSVGKVKAKNVAGIRQSPGACLAWPEGK
jgi:hypothetical protein